MHDASNSHEELYRIEYSITESVYWSATRPLVGLSLRLHWQKYLWSSVVYSIVAVLTARFVFSSYPIEVGSYLFLMALIFLGMFFYWIVWSYASYQESARCYKEPQLFTWEFSHDGFSMNDNKGWISSIAWKRVECIFASGSGIYLSFDQRAYFLPRTFLPENAENFIWAKVAKKSGRLSPIRVSRQA